MTTPLGQYGPIVAAIAALGVIGAYILAIFVRGVLPITDADMQSLFNLALVALGIVLGAAGAAGANRAEITAANRRLDAIGAPPATAAPATNGNGKGHG